MRRSPRLKEVNKGFKADCYTSKKCLVCNSDPPELSQVMIKKLGHNLCQIDEGLLSEEPLNQKKKKSISKKILKENIKPSKVISDVQDEEETLSQLKKRIKKTAAKKEAKKNKKSKGDDPNFQDEDGANPEASEVLHQQWK